MKFFHRMVRRVCSFSLLIRLLRETIHWRIEFSLRRALIEPNLDSLEYQPVERKCHESTKNRDALQLHLHDLNGASFERID